MKTIARMITRPKNEEGTETDLMLTTLTKSANDYLKANKVYELYYNELTEVIEFREVGNCTLSLKQWSLSYYNIPINFGNTIWLTDKEQLSINNEQ